MKIVINYDLIEKISEAKYGFSLVKSLKKETVIVSGAFGAILPFYTMSMDSITFDQYLERVPLYFLTNIGWLTLFDMFMDYKFYGKDESFADLSELSFDLEALYIETTDDLLLEAYKYKTEYEVKSEEILPRLIQRKYINVPTSDDKEVSLLEEHIVGSRVYTLSKGKPRKQVSFKFATNNS